MLCSKCAANLPEDSGFCPKCGERVSPPAGRADPPGTAILACSKCGATLPDGAQYCLKCGKPVSLPAKEPPQGESGVAGEIPAPLLRLRRERHVIPWFLLAFLVAAIVWAASSDSPAAQQVQEIVGWKHDRTILETPFSVGPHTFRYYKFSLPEGSVNVAIVGQFACSGESRSAAFKNAEKDAGKVIEVYVLSEPAFAVWQNGYAASTVYESGRVGGGTIQADLPAGPGIYYLVFSNKFELKSAKRVNATVLLRYRSWLPEWLRRVKDRLWNWIGLG